MSSTRKIDETIAAIPSEKWWVTAAVKHRWDSLTKPRGSLGRLESSVEQIARIQGTAHPRMERRGMYVFCGDHGITAEGVSPYPSVVTREMVRNFVSGGAAINVLSRQLGIETLIVDTGVAGPKLPGLIDRSLGEGTRNFLTEAAMSREQAIAAVESGIDLASEAAMRFDIAGVGEMGIGNSTSASALLCLFTGATAEEAVGRGAGLDDAGLRHKWAVLEQALRRVDAATMDPLAMAAEFGGFEIVTMAGFLLGAAAGRVPVVIDGFISSAAFLMAQRMYADMGRHVLFAHRSAEKGHARMIAETGAEPLLDLGMRLGEGTGAALAMGLLVSAVHLYRGMATFSEAAVSDKKEDLGNEYSD